MKKVLLVISFCFCLLNSYSQNNFQFKEGLSVNASMRYGREALYTDDLAFRIYTNTLSKPVAGDSFSVDNNGQVIKWQKIIVDSLLRFRGRGGFSGAGGYIYLTYTSDKAKAALLHIKGNSAVFFNNVLHAGDPYSSGWLYIPVLLKKGLNELFVRGQNNVVAEIVFPQKQIFINTEDSTLPFIVNGHENTFLKGAVVIMNTGSKELTGLKIKSKLSGKEMLTDIPAIPAMSSRKVIFDFNGSSNEQKGKHKCSLQLLAGTKVVDETTLEITTVEKNEHYSNTFVSEIDGSLQLFAVTPQTGLSQSGQALFFSVHGAAVEAINQARAYKPKDWGTLVAPTNRRPRGFNWEDWGRLDALEVLEIAKSKFKPDLQKIYLTGHSMGGHGTWFLGATYPDKWAAIAPCAGYPTLKGYGSADGLIPENSNSPIEQMLLRSSNQSDMIKLVSNYQSLGTYVFHGDADKVVSVNYARQMKKLLAGFHSDLSYYEYPGGEHWFGDHSVDWQPIFDFFKWHKLKLGDAVDSIDFMTANPGISSSFHWATVYQQEQSLQYSRIRLKRNKTTKIISGSTENIRLLKFDLKDFNPGDKIKIDLDNTFPVEYAVSGASDILFLLKENGKWKVSTVPDIQEKGPHRNGTFKDAFRNNMVFVYSTGGTKEENEWSLNKAKYDQESWYYRGNGAVDLIADKDFLVSNYKDRGVILFGNKTINKAWDQLLADCPIQVERNSIVAGSQKWQGADLAAYYIWPIRNSNIASVAVISGTGLDGMNAANANQYFAGASGFPDFMIYKINMLKTGISNVKMAGFYDYNWKLKDDSNVKSDQ